MPGDQRCTATGTDVRSLGQWIRRWEPAPTHAGITVIRHRAVRQPRTTSRLPSGATGGVIGANQHQDLRQRVPPTDQHPAPHPAPRCRSSGASRPGTVRAATGFEDSLCEPPVVPTGTTGKRRYSPAPLGIRCRVRRRCNDYGRA